MIISTAPGERAMRPEFGCAIWDQLFESMDADHARADANWPSARHWCAVGATGRGRRRSGPPPATATTAWSTSTSATAIRDRNDVRNLVYPFYVIPQE